MVTRATAIWIAAAASSVGAAGALVHGCGDDRAQVAAMIFQCDPTSPSANFDCGAGYTCYTATQALGGSFCVPKCDPATPSSCAGACTAAGECLTRCTVDDAKHGCTGGLSCVRTTVSPLESGADDGVCLAVNSLCADDQDCNSSVFNACSSDVSTIGLNVPLKGSFCIQTNCKADGTACTPGSSCIRNILGSLTQVPDVCAPNCVPHSPDDGGVRNYECVPGFLCLTTAFPQQTARVCAPGQAGWLCNDSLDCSAGKCQDWSDVSPSLAGLTACAPKCNTDDDCTRYDNGGNPTFISKLTCHAGGCRAQLTLLYADQCFQVGQPCSLDTGAACSDVRPFGGMPLASTDGGVPAAAGGRCLRGCANDGDCAPLTAVSHVPHLCDVVDHTCTPAVPFVAHCASDASCTGGLHCIPGLAACTRACSTESDCTNDPALGSAFTCPAGLCVPKKSSGEKAPASQCLSGTSDPMTGVCVSPSGWSCDDDAQCVSHNCKPIGPDSTDGRCE